MWPHHGLHHHRHHSDPPHHHEYRGGPTPNTQALRPWPIFRNLFKGGTTTGPSTSHFAATELLWGTSHHILLLRNFYEGLHITFCCYGTVMRDFTSHFCTELLWGIVLQTTTGNSTLLQNLKLLCCWIMTGFSSVQIAPQNCNVVWYTVLIYCFSLSKLCHLTTYKIYPLWRMALITFLLQPINNLKTPSKITFKWWPTLRQELILRKVTDLFEFDSQLLFEPSFVSSN